MKSVLKKLIKKVTPKILLQFLFPKRFQKYNRFITVQDSFANKPFKLFLREDSYMEKLILEYGLYGNWEKESLKIWAALCKNAHAILDIGANTGIFSMIAQNNNPHATVIAVEPVPINFNVLTENIKKNKFNIYTEKIALSNTDGLAKMFMLKDRLNYMTSVNDDRYANAPHVKGDYEVVEIEVPVKPFSYLTDKYQLDSIDLIKIDVEGHEIAVINAMLPYLKKHKPILLIEVIGDENAIILDTLFKEMNYKYISIDERHTSKAVHKLWDNHHHNFLICHQDTINYLQHKNLCTL
jgi:FkbM family methyltransferase